MHGYQSHFWDNILMINILIRLLELRLIHNDIDKYYLIYNNSILYLVYVKIFDWKSSYKNYFVDKNV